MHTSPTGLSVEAAVVAGAQQPLQQAGFGKCQTAADLTRSRSWCSPSCMGHCRCFSGANTHAKTPQRCLRQAAAQEQQQQQCSKAPAPTTVTSRREALAAAAALAGLASYTPAQPAHAAGQDPDLTVTQRVSSGTRHTPTSLVFPPCACLPCTSRHPSLYSPNDCNVPAVAECMH